MTNKTSHYDRSIVPGSVFKWGVPTLVVAVWEQEEYWYYMEAARYKLVVVTKRGLETTFTDHIEDILFLIAYPSR